MSSPIVCLIGSDYRTEYYIFLLQRYQFNISCIFDFESSDQALNISSKYNLPYFRENFDDFFIKSKFDVIFLFGSPSHYPYVSKKALLSGKHVVCPHVMGTNLMNCNEVYTLGIVEMNQLSIVLNPLRMLSAFKSIRRLYKSTVNVTTALIDCVIDCGSIIKSGYDDWIYERCMGGGLLYHIVSLYIDAISWIINKKCVSVNANLITCFSEPFKDRKLFGINADDYVAITANFENEVSVLQIKANGIGMSRQLSHSITFYADAFTASIVNYELKLLGKRRCGMHESNFNRNLIDLSDYINESNKIQKSDSTPLESSKSISNKEEITNNEQSNSGRSIRTIQPNVNFPLDMLIYGTEKTIKVLKGSFDENKQLNKKKIRNFQNFQEAYYVKNFIDAAIESNFEKSLVTLSSHILRLKSELMLQKILQDKFLTKIKNERSIEDVARIKPYKVQQPSRAAIHKKIL